MSIPTLKHLAACVVVDNTPMKVIEKNLHEDIVDLCIIAFQDLYRIPLIDEFYEKVSCVKYMWKPLRSIGGRKYQTALWRLIINLGKGRVIAMKKIAYHKTF